MFLFIVPSFIIISFIFSFLILGVQAEPCLELSRIFNELVDQPKTGKKVPFDPKKYFHPGKPHFMAPLQISFDINEKKPEEKSNEYYITEHILGINLPRVFVSFFFI